MSYLVRTAFCSAILASAARSNEPIKGITYGLSPFKDPAIASSLQQDDWFCDDASPLWSKEGRGDLRIIRSLGANLVRLYGNNPVNDHSKFLDDAFALGLGVAPGMSDWPFYQNQHGSCLAGADFNCFSQIQPLYLQNLQRGFLRPDGTYHPALRIMHIINEPDAKMPPTSNHGPQDGPVKTARTIISSFDAMLDAEREMHVTGPLINFTATFCYDRCASCSRFQDIPVMGQIAQLDDAMRHPEKYGYTPKNNITEAYRTRWTHSFNTANPADYLRREFFGVYAATFPTTPVYIAEYHKAGIDQEQDVSSILAVAEELPLFLGIAFSEYQVSYYKGGPELSFGLFGFANSALPQMKYAGMTFDVLCLAPVRVHGVYTAEALARVYGGRLNTSMLCKPDAIEFTSTSTTISTTSTTTATSSTSTTNTSTETSTTETTTTARNTSTLATTAMTTSTALATTATAASKVPVKVPVSSLAWAGSPRLLLLHSGLVLTLAGL